MWVGEDRLSELFISNRYRGIETCCQSLGYVIFNIIHERASVEITVSGRLCIVGDMAMIVTSIDFHFLSRSPLLGLELFSCGSELRTPQFYEFTSRRGCGKER